MTEEEWLACSDPEMMLEYVEGRLTARKVRLLACGLCRTYWGYFGDDRSRAAVEVAYRVADGLAGEEERARAFAEAFTAGGWTFDAGSDEQVAAYTCGTPEQVREVPWRAMRAFAFDIYLQPRQAVCALLRDLYGSDLFRPVTLAPSLLTSTVVALARGAYDEQAFDRLPILADALQDAGCDSDELLDHLRGPGPHVRGCWALDLVLGKS